MLQLLHPIWLIAMAGTLFPVIIHLWNNRQGKVLRIGSITFLEKGSLRQSRTRRLSEWWLLILRCLLLLLLALLLSGPFWQRSSAHTKTKGWVLGVKEDMRTPIYKSLIDSLLKEGYQWKEWRGLSGQTAGNKDGSDDRRGPSYWDLFREADHEAPAGIPFYIFTGGARSGFTGHRPVTGRMVHWYIYPTAADSAAQWIRQAWLSSPDSIRVQTGSSRPTGNSYSVQLLPAKTGTYPGPDGTLTEKKGYHVARSNGWLSVALDSQPPVVVDTASLRICVFADNKYNRDAGYLIAALAALKQFTGRNMQVTLSSPAALPERLSRPDWIFWLSASSLPAGLTAPNILCYERGKDIPVDTWMQGINGVGVSRRVDNDSLKGGESAGLWKDGFGRPLLSMQQTSEGRIFHFYSHFDPEWNGLVWSPRFPVLLEELMGAAASIGSDRRVLDPEQIQPEFVPGAMDQAAREAAGKPISGQNTNAHGDRVGGVTGLTTAQRTLTASAMDLAPVCWILIFLVFLTERILALRPPKIKTDG